MLALNIPGRELILHHLVLDFNGTIAFDGQLIPGAAERIEQLSKKVKIHVITADTNGSVRQQCKELPVSIHVLSTKDHTDEKGAFVRSLNGVLSIGNGANDEAMFEASDAAIAVISREGCSTAAWLKSDAVFTSVIDVLDGLLHPHRLIATLRK